MPCGGGDIGMNVWVEEGDVLFYLSRSGTFDENNCLLKQGRFRIRLSPNPFKETKEFRHQIPIRTLAVLCLYINSDCPLDSTPHFSLFKCKSTHIQRHLHYF